MNALIVEDDPDYALILSHGLKAQRSVSRATTFAQASTLLERIPMGLILLDLSLPDSSAADTLARIPELRVRASAGKIVVLTGDPRAETRVSAYAAGADLVLYKDMDFRTTVAQIMKLFKKPDGAPPAVCLDQDTVDLIENRVRWIVAEAKALPSIPSHTARAVVAMLTPGEVSG